MMLIAQVVFLLECRHTYAHKSQTPLITLSTYLSYRRRGYKQVSAAADGSARRAASRQHAHRVAHSTMLMRLLF